MTDNKTHKVPFGTHYTRSDGSGYSHYKYEDMPTVTSYKKLINTPWEAALKMASRNPEWRLTYGMTPDLETANAVTGGVMNWTTPSLIVGFGSDLLDSKHSFGNSMTRLVTGNSGLVSDNIYKNYPISSMIVNGLGDAIIPMSTYKGYNIGKLIFIPENRAAHAYVNISPVGYDHPIKRGVGWVKGMLSGMDADIENPKWDFKELKKYTGEYLPPSVKNREDIASLTRIDAWRLYNHLPQKYNMYIPNADGTYSYNMNKIINMSENTFLPVIGVRHDYVTGAGGGLTKSDSLTLAFLGNKTYGLQTIEDIWDLLPFNRAKDRITNRFPSILKPIEKFNTIRDNISAKIFNLGTNIAIDNKSAKDFLKNATEEEEAWFDPNMFERDSKLLRKIGRGIQNFGLHIKSKRPAWDYNFIKKLNTWGQNFEVGLISGGTPFKMHTEIPYTLILKVSTSEGKSPINLYYLYGFVPNEGYLLPYELLSYSMLKKFSKFLQNNKDIVPLDIKDIKIPQIIVKPLKED